MAGIYNKHKQDGSHLGFPIKMILATVDLQFTSMLSMNFGVGSGEKVQNKIFKMATIAAIWDSLSQPFELFFIYMFKSSPMLPIKFRVNWPFSSEEEWKNRFSKWPPCWISDWNDFSYFYIYKSFQSFLPIFKSTGPLVQENKRKKSFKMAAMMAILDFRSKQFKLF